MNINRSRLFAKWFLLVWLNAALSYVIAVTEYPHPADILGVSCAVLVFVLFYYRLDHILLKRGRQDWRAALLWGAILKILTQVVMTIEMMTGLVAISVSEALFGDIKFVMVFFATLLDGIFLSLLVALFMLLVKLIMYIINVNKVNTVEKNQHE